MGQENKALFLDRDGTLIEHIPYLHDPEGVLLLPGVKDALHTALRAGFQLFLLTNQSGVGRGYFGMEDVHACNERMLELLQLPLPGFSGICIAPEAPGGTTHYRKPSPRYINEMISSHRLDPANCWMIGDSDCDIEAGKRAAIHTFRVGPERSLVEVVREILCGQE